MREYAQAIKVKQDYRMRHDQKRIFFVCARKQRQGSTDSMNANARMTARLAWGALCIALAGMVVLTGFAAIEKSWLVLIIGALVAFSASTLGTLGGFLFGLPRYNPTSTIAAPVDVTTETSQLNANLEDRTRAASSTFMPGNNLEQISDWLTKLLLGAGLTQLGSIMHWMGGFIDRLAYSFTVDTTVVSAARIAVGGLIVIYSTLGFLFGYIATTLWYRNRLVDFINAWRG